MAEGAPERDERPTSLAAAIRTARIESAARSQALGDLRDAELSRLDLLRELLEPVLAQVPSEVDLFDTGVVPGEHPRLFIDMVAFVEVARDRRTYRFVQDRRHARVVLAETEGVGAMVGAVTAYIARRLVEREQLLASLGRDDAVQPADPKAAAPTVPGARPPRRRFGALLVGAWVLRLVIDGLGVATLGALIWFGAHFVHGRLPGW